MSSLAKLFAELGCFEALLEGHRVENKDDLETQCSVFWQIFGCPREWVRVTELAGSVLPLEERLCSGGLGGMKSADLATGFRSPVW